MRTTGATAEGRAKFPLVTSSVLGTRVIGYPSRVLISARHRARHLGVSDALRRNGMNVLVTGAAGFIGSHVVERLLDDGHSVIGVDNFLTGSPSNVAWAEGHDRFALVECDVTGDWAQISAAFENARRGPDLILHLASPASPVDYATYPLETLAANSRGTERVLQAALHYGCRVVYASTSETYGDPHEHPQRETYWGHVNPVGERSCYDESKRFGEALVMAFVRVHGVDARIVRIFNTYGPRMRRNDGRVVPNFVAQALGGEPLTIYGDGSQTRSFCYVSDLVEGLLCCAAAPRARGRVVNLGNPQEHSVRDFARIVAELVGVPLVIVAAPLPADDPGRRCPDIGLARELFGWAPKVGLEEGLRRTIAWFAAGVAAA